MVTPKQLGHLVIRVRDLERSERFYADILGLTLTNKRPGEMTFMSANAGMSHELALVPVGADAPGPEEDRVGLFHFAWEMESLDDLKRLYAVIRENDVPVERVGDHGISLGVYFRDPDGNEIEAYYEVPKGEWPKEGDLFAGRIPGRAGVGGLIAGRASAAIAAPPLHVRIFRRRAAADARPTDSLQG